MSADSQSNAASKCAGEVYFAALAIESDEERRAFLADACSDDTAARAELEHLLAAQGDADEWFQDIRPGTVSVVDLTREVMEEPVDDEVGKRIGNYTLLEKIGEGGGGTVYLAEQTKPMRRRVAFKIIKRGMDTKRVIARFEAERQALAMMEHPNIAHVLNAGETESGRPFFVMELVPGVRITDYCDENKLDIPQRLKLFVQVCHAIQHAHQKGIIHRDIKPSNVLITLRDGAPMPKVIDFGIAKATSGDLLSEESVHTSFEPLMGTPAYMSPEQARMSRDDIDTRCDIYSLGVLLYELLVGKPPFDRCELLSKGLDEMRRILCECEPSRPSVMLGRLEMDQQRRVAENRASVPPRLNVALGADLDYFVIKALEKDRARRYDTASELALDVLRHLNHEPVEARPPSRVYRFQKLVRRNKVVFAAGAAVLLALIGGLGTATWMFFKAEEAWANEAELRMRAESREQLTEAVILVNQGDYEGAATLIRSIQVPPTRPSLDGVAALRAVGEWLALQERWRESAERFTELMEIDELDTWDSVTLDFQACGVVLVEAGDLEGYAHFREKAVARFLSETSGDAASRILKTCLLRDVNEDALAMLRPLGTRTEHWAAGLPESKRSGWAAIPIALWQYRTGRFDESEGYCRDVLNPPMSPALQATGHLILSMTCHRIGRAGLAREYLAQGRALVENKFAAGLDGENEHNESWYDWVFARILLREAETLIE